ncbi:cystatin-A-like [Dendrobates tinctorius]|uniref:cystatin-A-like n=1 Tax=Dendrobates tinctorius TaxID=92724 RepID=UPI003CCA025B
MSGLPGGFGPEKPANERIQAACDWVRNEFQYQSGINAGEFTALVYRLQVVAGYNYIVKVAIGGQFCHVKIFEPLSNAAEEPKLLGFQCGKTKEETIAVF